MNVSHTFTVPGWHPATTNQLLKMFWASAANLKRCDKQIVAHYGEKIPKATKQRSVQLTIIRNKGRKPDPDAHFKSALDALVSCGLLKDDSDKWVILLPAQYEKGEKATRITLTEVL